MRLLTRLEDWLRFAGCVPPKVGVCDGDAWRCGCGRVWFRIDGRWVEDR